MAESVSSAAAKVCAACSKDVTNLPRTKDGQGRYFCKPCVDKLKAKSAKAPAQAETPEDTDVMAKLLASSPGVELCPNCGGGINVGAKICVRCGFNKESGKAMKVVVERAKQEKEPKVKGRRSGNFVISEGLYLLILCAVVGGGFTLSMFEPAFGALLYIICSILFMVAWIWGIIAAFKDDEGLAGICGILGFFIFGIPWIYFVYWCIFATWRGYLKMTIAGALLGAILGAIGMFGHLTDDLDDSRGTRSTQRSRAAPINDDEIDPSEETTPAKPANPNPSDGTVLGG